MLPAASAATPCAVPTLEFSATAGVGGGTPPATVEMVYCCDQPAAPDNSNAASAATNRVRSARPSKTPSSVVWRAIGGPPQIRFGFPTRIKEVRQVREDPFTPEYRSEEPPAREK